MWHTLGKLSCLPSVSMSFMQVSVISKRFGKNVHTKFIDFLLWLSPFLDFYPQFPLTTDVPYSILWYYTPEKLCFLSCFLL